MKDRLTVKGNSFAGGKNNPRTSPGLRICKDTAITLESGETIRKGCGQRGMMPFEVGWRCFYCGNYFYNSKITLEDLWLHFKILREYRAAMTIDGRDYINGIPVSGQAEDLPATLLADLVEVKPPNWFYYYVKCDEQEFEHYLKNY
ncbi:MAG: hypothetical protein ACE5EK_00775 [Nitrospinales bacterium]